MSFECEVDGRNLSDKFKAMLKNRLKSDSEWVRCILDQRDLRTTMIGWIIHYSQRIWLHLTASDCL